ncbi:SDR family NAD(P)-dependent oxidoreductase [Streptomonospora alba]|uniref:SDR family NAD(P)-dependent oxidoreductase n=1 Tax=Streptomonospora alba TaxID=183763 RepID=UPI000A0742D5
MTARDAGESASAPASRPGTALVTGASSGIGRETARLLAEKGFRVFGISRADRPDFAGVSLAPRSPHPTAAPSGSAIGTGIAGRVTGTSWRPLPPGACRCGAFVHRRR